MIHEHIVVKKIRNHLCLLAGSWLPAAAAACSAAPGCWLPACCLTQPQKLHGVVRPQSRGRAARPQNRGRAVRVPCEAAAAGWICYLQTGYTSTYTLIARSFFMGYGLTVKVVSCKCIPYICSKIFPIKLL